jgi:hypothetical protein
VQESEATMSGLVAFTAPNDKYVNFVLEITGLRMGFARFSVVWYDGLFVMSPKQQSMLRFDLVLRQH